MSVYHDLARRQRDGNPIRVAVVGTGYFGSGLVKQMSRMPGLSTPVVANRTIERGIAALVAAGVDPDHVIVCNDLRSANQALAEGLSVATSRLDLPAALDAVEVVMEATGDVVVGTEVAVAAIQHGKHLVAANPETQATVGPVLKTMADRAGVVYSDVDGDQPGILKNLYDYCTALGFTPVVAGNCKGVLKRYATPETQTAFAEANGLKAWIASAAADGTKLNIEMAAVANALGMPPATVGMAGVQTTLETLLVDFERLGLLDRGPIVEYTLGIPNGVFIVVRSDDAEIQRDFRYLKMGDGPYYVLYRPHVLVHYEAPLSAAEAALYGVATITPNGRPVADVASYAKHDLPAVQRIDGIGGFDCYGLIATMEQAQRDRLLPIGLAHFVRLTRSIAKDQPITLDDVEFVEENIATRLRREQDAMFAGPALAGAGRAR